MNLLETIVKDYRVQIKVASIQNGMLTFESTLTIYDRRTEEVIMEGSIFNPPSIEYQSTHGVIRE